MKKELHPELKIALERWADWVWGRELRAVSRKYHDLRRRLEMSVVGMDADAEEMRRTLDLSRYREAVEGTLSEMTTALRTQDGRLAVGLVKELPASMRAEARHVIRKELPAGSGMLTADELFERLRRDGWTAKDAHGSPKGLSTWLKRHGCKPDSKGRRGRAGFRDRWRWARAVRALGSKVQKGKQKNSP
jgi:hypothetical protein